MLTKQTTSSLAGDAGSSQNGGVHGITDSGTGNAINSKKHHRIISGVTCNGLYHSAASVSALQPGYRCR